VAWVFVQFLKIIVPFVDCTTVFSGVCGVPKGTIPSLIEMAKVVEESEG
jgi:hypothetical protein